MAFPRYVRACLSARAPPSATVAGVALQRVFEQLANPRYAGCTISTIAYDAGFNNLVVLDRAFRQRFAATPSDVRQLHAQQSGA